MCASRYGEGINKQGTSSRGKENSGNGEHTHLLPPVGDEESLLIVGRLFEWGSVWERVRLLCRVVDAASVGSDEKSDNSRLVVTEHFGSWWHGVAFSGLGSFILSPQRCHGTLPVLKKSKI